MPTQIVDYKRAAIETSRTQETYRLKIMSASRNLSSSGLHCLTAIIHLLYLLIFLGSIPKHNKTPPRELTLNLDLPKYMTCPRDIIKYLLNMILSNDDINHVIISAEKVTSTYEFLVHIVSGWLLFANDS